MRFQLLAARAALAVLVLGVLLAAIAVGGVRLGQLSDPAGTNLMVPATGRAFWRWRWRWPGSIRPSPATRARESGWG